MIYLYNELLVVFVHAFHSETKVLCVSSVFYQDKVFFTLPNISNMTDWENLKVISHLKQMNRSSINFVLNS